MSAKPCWFMTPRTTSMPAPSSTWAPPLESIPGSSTLKTTREIPASTSALAHGPVLPVCAQGSKVTTAVRPSVETPAARALAMAMTSACGVPDPSCQPSAQMAPELSRRTHPTRGLPPVSGPLVASSRARPIAVARATVGVVLAFIRFSTPLGGDSGDGNAKPG